MEKFRVLSLFDGCAMAYAALKLSGITHNKSVTYFASEIDAYAALVADKRVPYYRNVGDVRLVSGYSYYGWDLLIGGSPCTQLSIAGNGQGLAGEASSLFWEFVRIKNEGNFKYFLLENVASMRKADRDKISEAMGCEPIRINSALFSAQSRDRLYWTNIPVGDLPEDRGYLLKHVLESEWDDKYNLSEKAIAYMSRSHTADKTKQRWNFMPNKLEGKSATLTANMWKGVPYGVIKEQMRRLTPTECERLQQLPSGWTDVEGVSETQRYKMIGNGFTVGVIAFILSHIKTT